MNCKCGRAFVPVACPDGKLGCAVAHFGCPACTLEQRDRRRQEEAMDALREANGLK